MGRADRRSQRGRGEAGRFIHPRLYAAAAAFHNIVTGTNKVGSVGYRAATGWNAFTGLGTPDGTKLLTLLRQ